MLKELLSKALNIFHRKDKNRESLENKGKTKVDEKISDKNKKGEPKMSEEIKKTEEVEKVEEKKPADTATENKEVDKKVEETKEEPKTDEPKVDAEAEPTQEPAGEAPQVTETEPTGNGVRVEDLVTKDLLLEKLSAFEAKFNAVLKENEDLKNKVSEMQDKYENKDFGGNQRQGVIEKDSDANDTFEEYSKHFM